MRNFSVRLWAAFAWLVVGMVASGAWAQTTRPVAYGENSAVGKYYEINGFEMYVEEYGEGPAVLMIHGNGGSMKAFSMNAAYFARNHRVILVDSRSQGKSVDPDHPITFEMMADDFAALLDAMHIESADVVGWSDGGINAIVMAMRHPGKVRRIVATGANLWNGPEVFKPGVWESGQAWLKANRDKPPSDAKARNGWKLMRLDELEPKITLEQLRGIECPCLIMCGDHDLISIEHTLTIYQNLKHANLWVVPNSGHATLMEHAEDFNRVVGRFLEGEFKDHK
jgi:pimeloyl-ACP methyl ester carboxylesterase